MKRFIMILGVAGLLLSACGGAAEGIEVHDPWARPTAQGENAAVYFQLHNHSQDTDELIGASSNVSDNVEIHESKMENDVMQMSMVPSIPLGADEEVTFAPGGYHIMLINIKQEFKAGDQIEVVLHFKNHEDLVMNVSVGDSSADDTEHEHGHEE